MFSILYRLIQTDERPERSLTFHAE